MTSPSILGIIPARGGSKRVPRKNVRLFAGKPLIAWTIEAARQSRLLSRLIVSSEDPEIHAIARQWGCEVPFVRPPELAADDTPGIAPVLHAIEAFPEYEYITLLQPTSPLRRTEDIDHCIQLVLQRQTASAVSVCPLAKNPYWMMTLTPDQRLRQFLPPPCDQSPAPPPVFVLNGAVYVAQRQRLVSDKTFITDDTLGFVMPIERSLDVDTEHDLLLADLLLRQQR